MPPANSVKFVLNERRKQNRIMSGPAAEKEYMSKIARGKGKNEDAPRCWSRNDLLPDCLSASPRAQRNDVGSGGQSGGHLGGSAGGDDQVVIVTGPKTTEDRG